MLNIYSKKEGRFYTGKEENGENGYMGVRGSDKIFKKKIRAYRKHQNEDIETPWEANINKHSQFLYIYIYIYIYIGNYLSLLWSSRPKKLG